MMMARRRVITLASLYQPLPTISSTPSLLHKAQRHYTSTPLSSTTTDPPKQGFFSTFSKDAISSSLIGLLGVGIGIAYIVSHLEGDKQMKDVIRKTEELQYEVQQLRHSDGILSQNYEHLVTDVLQLYEERSPGGTNLRAEDVRTTIATS